jgi:hypothetical protein
MGAWFQFQVGQGGYREADTMVKGEFVKMVGRKIYVGIHYSLQRNSRGMGV